MRKLFLFIVIFGSVIFYLTPYSVSAQDYLTVFAANLESSGNVHREDASGADLYTVRFNPTTKTVTDLTQVTAYSDAAEWFPSLSHDTKWIAYNYYKQNRNEVRVLNRLTGEEATVFAGGRFPEWVGNNKLLVSNQIIGKKDIFLVELDLTSPIPAVVSVERITDRNRCPGTSLAGDAYPFPDNQKIAFHILRQSGEPGAAMAIMNLDGTNFTRLTDWNGSGHGIVNSEGNEIVCSLSGVGLPVVLKLEGDSTTTIGLPLSTDAADMSSFDSRFNEVAKIHWSYGAWGSDNHSLFLNGQGSSADNVISFSRLLYVSFNDQWESPNIFNFSSAIENLAGKSGRDFCTASFRPIPTESEKVYVCLFMHNEDYNHPSYPDFSLPDNQDAYLETRNNLVLFCEMVHRNNVPFNWQTDWNFLYGVLKWDTPEVMVNTNGKNVVRYLAEDLGITVDPHSHENCGHNYADVAYLIDSLGVTPTNVIGGHIWDPADSEYQDWERFREPIRGKMYPQAIWHGNILIGHGTNQHVNDPEASGVWKPKGKYNFWEHDSNGTVYAIGQYKNDFNGVFDLINLHESGSISKDKILTLSISSDQYRLNDSYIIYFEDHIIKPLIDLQYAGKIQIVTFGELISIWKTKFDSVAHIYNALDQSSIRKNKNTNFYFNLNQNYPNPFNSSTAIGYQLSAVSFVELIIYNILGKKIRTFINKQETAGEHSVIWDGKDDFDNFVSSGVYFYQLKTKNDFSEVKKMLYLK